MRANILLSGGLDSAILSGILQQKGYKVKAYTFDQANSLTFAKKISDILNIHLNLINIEVKNDRQEVNRAVEYLIDQDIGNIHIGITAVPKINFSIQEQIPNRPSSQIINELSAGKVIAPYANMTKDKVLQIGIDRLKNIDELIKYSHSCYRTNNIRCGECFNCEERKWAFDSVGIIDKGKY